MMRLKISILAITIFAVSCTVSKKKTVVREIENNEEILSVTYPYRPSRTLLNDLVHTKLVVNFDWAKKRMNGKATLTFKPYFYPQSKLELDAKGFDIRAVQLVKGNVKTNLAYQYDTTQNDHYP